MVIKIRRKKPWQIAQGEQPHKRGEVFQDRRERRQRTRQTQRKQWEKEYA